MKTFSYLTLAALTLLGSSSAFASSCPSGYSKILQPFIITNDSSYKMVQNGYHASNNSSAFYNIDQPQEINSKYQEAGSFIYCCNSSTQNTLTLQYDFIEANDKAYNTNLNFNVKGCAIEPSVSSCAPGVSCPGPQAGSTIEFTFGS